MSGSDTAKLILYLNLYALLLIIIILSTKKVADYVIWIFFSLTLVSCLGSGFYLWYNSSSYINMKYKFGDLLQDYKAKKEEEEAKFNNPTIPKLESGKRFNTLVEESSPASLPGLQTQVVMPSESKNE